MYMKQRRAQKYTHSVEVVQIHSGSSRTAWLRRTSVGWISQHGIRFRDGSYRSSNLSDVEYLPETLIALDAPVILYPTKYFDR